MAAFCHVIKTECNGETYYEKRSYNLDTKEVSRQQQEIGVHLMPWGFLVKGWMTAKEILGASHPECRMNTLQRMTWDTIMDPLWQEHNDMKHWKDNTYDAVKDERPTERIVWYVDHRHELVAVPSRNRSDRTAQDEQRNKAKVDLPSKHSKIGMGGRESRRTKTNRY